MVLLMYVGHLDCVKYLVEKGANIEKKDKLMKTPSQSRCCSHMHKLLNDQFMLLLKWSILTSEIVMYAAKNGHLHVLSYLAHMGGNANARDSSGNSIVHYAAGYGWHQ